MGDWLHTRLQLFWELMTPYACVPAAGGGAAIPFLDIWQAIPVAVDVDQHGVCPGTHAEEGSSGAERRGGRERGAGRWVGAWGEGA